MIAISLRFLTASLHQARTRGARAAAGIFALASWPQAEKGPTPKCVGRRRAEYQTGPYTAKRVMRLTISILVFAAGWLCDLGRRLLSRQARGRFVIVYYHAVPDRCRARFEKQMVILRRLAEPVPAVPGIHVPRGTRWAAVTFDDAYRDILRNAIPALVKGRIPATIFVVTQALGTTPEWSDTSADQRPETAIMDASELKRLRHSLITIGSHTQSHPYLPDLPAEQARAELAESKRELEALLGIPVLTFSFPYGAHTPKLVEWCHEAGYQVVFTTLPVLVSGEPDQFVAGRVRVDPTDWTLEFRLKVLGAYRWLPNVRSFKRRLLGRMLSNIGEQDLRLVAPVESGPSPIPSSCLGSEGESCTESSSGSCRQ